VIRAWVLGLVLLAAARAGAEPKESHRAELRVQHIQAALEAIHETPAEELRRQDEYAQALGRGACSSGVERLKVECLMTASRRYCKKRGEAETRRCNAGMDVIVSNLLGDRQLISTEQRYQVMKQHKDYRRELARETRRIQGSLAVDFRLHTGTAEDDATTAKNIDQYCLGTADETNLAWQTCVSSLVWFLRAAGADSSPPRESKREP
jgi:hypothetical protein